MSLAKDKAKRNDITGDYIRTKDVSESYRSNYDNIDWSKKDTNKTVECGSKDLMEEESK